MVDFKGERQLNLAFKSNSEIFFGFIRKFRGKKMFGTFRAQNVKAKICCWVTGVAIAVKKTLKTECYIFLENV